MKLAGMIISLVLAAALEVLRQGYVNSAHESCRNHKRRTTIF